MIPLASSCEARSTYDQLFESLVSVIDTVDSEISGWSPEAKLAKKYQKRGIRAEKWLRSILESTERFVAYFSFINNIFSGSWIAESALRNWQLHLKTFQNRFCPQTATLELRIPLRSVTSLVTSSTGSSPNAPTLAKTTKSVSWANDAKK